MKMLNKCFIIFTIFTGPSDVFSQSFIPKWELGANFGLFVYQGDLTPSRTGSIRTGRFGFNLFANKLLSNAIAIRANLAIAGLKGNDAAYTHPAYRQDRALNFKSPVTEVSVLGVWTPFGHRFEGFGGSPYFFTGLGYSFLHIKRDWSNINTAAFSAETGVLQGLQEDIQHALPRGTLVIPAGAGMRYLISPSFLIQAEIFYRFTFTDYLDGFSKAANPSRKDQYYSATLGLIYRLGNKNKLNCPPVKN
ncbi:MAG TPA: DUF6089 family protein [Chitinophagaceae bacterium]|nr:DUF6089 family protein [Chitinophagaceae bacterium]